MIERLAWVTTGEDRGLDEDEPHCLAALTGTGASVEVVDWDDPASGLGNEEPYPTAP